MKDTNPKNIFKRSHLFFKKPKVKKVINMIIFIFIICILSVGAWLILRSFGVTDINHLREIVSKVGIWGWLVFLILQITVTTVLTLIPATNAIFITVGVLIFGPQNAFFICTVGVFISSTMMFYVGKKFGEPLVKKLVGENSLKKAQELVDIKSKIFLPLMFLFPLFPDDALCLVAGMTKMKYRHFALIVGVFRTIGVASFCLYGSDFVRNIVSQFTFVDWVIVVNLILIDVYFIILFAKKLESYILSREKKQDEIGG